MSAKNLIHCGNHGFDKFVRLEHLKNLPIDQKTILSRGLRVRCPNCGEKGLMRGHFRVYYRCPHCGMKVHRSSGFQLGAMTWNYGITVFGVLPLWLLGGLLGLISAKFVMILCAGSALVAPVLLYPFAWGCWVATYYFFLPHELPANETEALPMDEDE